MKQSFEAGHGNDVVDAANDQTHETELEVGLDGAGMAGVLAVPVVLSVQLPDGRKELFNSGLALFDFVRSVGEEAELLADGQGVFIAAFQDELAELGDLEVVGHVRQAHVGDEGVLGVLVELGGDVDG